MNDPATILAVQLMREFLAKESAHIARDGDIIMCRHCCMACDLMSEIPHVDTCIIAKAKAFLKGKP